MPWLLPKALASSPTDQVAYFSTWDLPGSASQSFCKRLWTFHLSPIYLSGEAFSQFLCGCSHITEFYTALVMVTMFYLTPASSPTVEKEWGDISPASQQAKKRDRSSLFWPSLLIPAHRGAMTRWISELGRRGNARASQGPGRALVCPASRQKGSLGKKSKSGETHSGGQWLWIQIPSCSLAFIH